VGVVKAATIHRMDLSKILVSEIQLSYMAHAGHIRFSTVEDAFYVTLDPDDLVVISGTDDDLPIWKDNNHTILSNLVDNDVLDCEHLL
jgi:hypothetical protein